MQAFNPRMLKQANLCEFKDWSTELVPGQLGLLHRETLSQKTKAKSFPNVSGRWTYLGVTSSSCSQSVHYKDTSTRAVGDKGTAQHRQWYKILLGHV